MDGGIWRPVSSRKMRSIAVSGRRGFRWCIQHLPRHDTKALSQNPDPRSLTYLIEALNRALEEDERKNLPKPRDPTQPKEGRTPTA